MPMQITVIPMHGKPSDPLEAALERIRTAVDEAEHELMTERHGQKQEETGEGESEAPEGE